MAADPLSDILAFVKARSFTTGGVIAGGSWALRFPPPDKIKLFALSRGGCWLLLGGDEPPRRLEPGDVILLAARRPFTLAGDLAAAPTDIHAIYRRAVDGIARCGDGEDLFLLGGHVRLDPVRGALLHEVLPPLVHVRGTDAEAPTLRWLLDQLTRELAAERPGASLASEQLTQLIFVHVLRAHLASAGSLEAGWLRGLADDRIAPALRLLHGDPGRAWQLGELARAVAMSRTTFALRFKEVVGEAPLTYLLHWRMRLAERALREESTAVSDLAATLGYASDSAFSNAFKRTTGLAPRRYRSAFQTSVFPASGELDEAGL